MVKGMAWFQAVGTLPLLFENNERWAIGKGRNQCLVHPISRLKAVLLLRQNRRMPQLILSFLALACSLSASAQSQPNFVFIIADDLGWADVEFHGGNTPTPNLDQLLAEGIELKQHYVAPVCSPTRAGFLTGRYWSRFGITTPINNQGLPFETVTVAKALAEVGYSTALIGKWLSRTKMGRRELVARADRQSKIGQTKPPHCWPRWKPMALRDGDWKLILTQHKNRDSSGKPKVELFNLVNDPNEESEVAGKNPEKVKELKETLDKQRKLDLPSRGGL